MSIMLESLREARAAKAAEAADLLSGEPTADALATVEARHAEIEIIDGQIKTVEATEARSAVIAEKRADIGLAYVKSEPMTYAERGERSFVRDMINATLRNDQTAWSALHRHQGEMAVESRDVSRVDGGIGEFVPPLWLVDLYAKTLRPARTTANLLTTMALPAGTDSVNIPMITTGSDVAAQTADNVATQTTDMVTTSVAAPVRTISGYENVSIQTVEQSPLAGGLDRMIFTDLLAAYDYRLNGQVISGVGTAGQMYGLLNTVGIGTVTYTSGTVTGAAISASAAKALSQVAKNRFKGVEAFVIHPSIWYWLVGQADTTGRPIVVPNQNGPWNAFGANDAPGVAQGAVGNLLGVPVYLDATVPTNLGAGTNESAIIASAFSDTILMEGGVKTRVLPDVLSANLTVRFQVYGYVAMAARYPAGIAKIVGTGVIPQTGY
jgi:HK97 family phage major capsid protein